MEPHRPIEWIGVEPSYLGIVRSVRAMAPASWPARIETSTFDIPRCPNGTPVVPLIHLGIMKRSVMAGETKHG